MGHWLRDDLGFTKPDWYRPYSKLNQMKHPPSEAMLQEIQINQIRAHNVGAEKEIAQLNNFLQELRTYVTDVPGENDFFERLLRRINSGFAQVQEGMRPDTVDIAYIQKYEEDVAGFLDKIAAFSNSEIPENVIHDLHRIVYHLQQGEGGKWGFINRKGQLWEDIAAWIVELAGFRTLNTGPMIDAAGKQLIEDVTGFLVDGLGREIPQGKGALTFSLRITGEDTKKANKPLLEYLKQKMPEQADTIRFGHNNFIEVSLENDVKGFNDFMREVNHALDRKITVKVSDDFQQRISQGLTVQAKSGGQQKLLNNMKRDRISPRMLAEWDSYIALLNKFYATYGDVAGEPGATSDELSTYANWVFSTHIAETTLGKNRFFLSRHGFSTLDDQMQDGNFYFLLSPSAASLDILCASDGFDIMDSSGE